MYALWPIWERQALELDAHDNKPIQSHACMGAAALKRCVQ